MSKRIIWRSLIVLTLVVGVSCVPYTYKLKFYDLVALAKQSHSGKKIPAHINIGISRIAVADYLKHPALVSFNKNMHEVSIATEHAWAGELPSSLLRVITTNLSVLLDHPQVWASPWPHLLNPEYRVHLFIHTLGGQLDDGIKLQVKWNITKRKGLKIVVVKDSIFYVKSEGATHSQYVVAMNKALYQLSKEIAVELLSINY